jgi:N-acetyl-gamma-glutamyl-phosphate reductase
MVKIGIVGATGYTGVELIRLLALHPEVELVVATSNSEEGKRIDTVFPALRSCTDLSFQVHDTAELEQCELVFFATPHAAAMYQVPKLLTSGCKVIDLSADFRLNDAETWCKWYDVEHACSDLLNEAIYGLPELNRESIRQAKLVANPGCYPTAISLALLPALQGGMIELDNIIADAKSGVSGAGRKAALAGLHAEVSESFKAYGVKGHRHLPEILQTLRMAAGNDDVNLTFVPHLVPMNRGILATVYVQALQQESDWQKTYESFYQQESFVDVLPEGALPETRFVRGTNLCQLAIHKDIQGTKQTVIVSAIDNLVKGAAGQAIQNMNLMLGFEETMGLQASGLFP